MRGITFPIGWVTGSWVCYLRDVLQLYAGLACKNSKFDNSYCNKIQSPHGHPPFRSTSQVPDSRNPYGWYPLKVRQITRASHAIVCTTVQEMW